MVHLGMQITILELNSQVSFVLWWSNKLWQPAENTETVIVTEASVRITLCWQHWEEGEQMHSPMAFKHSRKGWNHGTVSAGHSPVTALLSAAASWDLHVDAKHLHEPDTKLWSAREHWTAKVLNQKRSCDSVSSTSIQVPPSMTSIPVIHWRANTIQMLFVCS